jgi:hypothetical protein
LHADTRQELRKNLAELENLRATLACGWSSYQSLILNTTFPFFLPLSTYLCADITLTQKLKQAATFFDMTVLDHIILTSDEYLSFSDKGLL